MSEEHNNTSAGSGFAVRDLFIPVSIVIAGLFIGIGLYLGGLSGGVGVPVPDEASPEAAVTANSLELVTPVTEDDHVVGTIDAPIKIIEYSDFGCGFCARFHDTMKIVTEKYGDTVAWVYRHFPIRAPGVALASECVAGLGGNEAFWTFTNGYYDAVNSGEAGDQASLVSELVAAAGVQPAEFDQCMEEERFAAEIQSDRDNAVETGGNGTPWSILVGPSGKTYPINGAVPIEVVEQLIQVAQEEA